MHFRKPVTPKPFALPALLALLTWLISVGCVTTPQQPREDATDRILLDTGVVMTEEQIQAVLGVLDQFMDALNDLDIEAHSATYHFPHYRHASGKVVIWQNAREAMPILDIPVAERRRALRGSLEPDWQRSEWTRRKIVQASPGKVHVATRFVRLRDDGSVIKTFDSLYVLTFQDGRWGVKGRSSFAP